MQIQLRPYHNQDFQPLEKIIRKTWHYDQFCGPKAAARLARVFEQLSDELYFFPCRRHRRKS